MSETLLLLGRHGDLITCLPFMKAEADAGRRYRLVVSNQHSNLLEGVSYVDVVEWPQGIHLLKEAYEWAQKQFGKVRSLQVIGNKEVVRDVTYRPANTDAARTTSFVKEMWRCAGQMHRWDDVLPLVFDRRSPTREMRLVEKYLPKVMGRPKKTMLVFTKSHSSPFPWEGLLLDILKYHLSKSYRIVVNPEAERIYDLLALYEKADAIIAVDSAPLHLARAVPTVPVYTLAQDTPTVWNGTPWMPNHQWYCRYSHFPNRAIEMITSIEEERWSFKINGLQVVGVSDSGSCGGSSVVVRWGMTGRDSRDIGDEKAIPYFKDCLRMGLQKAKDTDNVAVVMDGTELDCNPLAKYIVPCFAYRIQNQSFAPVVDLFCAPKSWWKQRLPEIPDYIFGKDHYWRNGLWAMFKKYHATDATGICNRPTAKA